jgi:hypothetical protein
MCVTMCEFFRKRINGASQNILQLYFMLQGQLRKLRYVLIDAVREQIQDLLGYNHTLRNDMDESPLLLGDNGRPDDSYDVQMKDRWIGILWIPALRQKHERNADTRGWSRRLSQVCFENPQMLKRLM